MAARKVYKRRMPTPPENLVTVECVDCGAQMKAFPNDVHRRTGKRHCIECGSTFLAFPSQIGRHVRDSR